MIVINHDNHLVTKNSKQIKLSTIQYHVLFCLAKANGKLLTREEIVKTALHSPFLQARNIDVHVNALRKLVSRESIDTVIGVGYKMNMTNVQIIQTVSNDVPYLNDDKLEIGHVHVHADVKISKQVLPIKEAYMNGKPCVIFSIINSPDVWEVLEKNDFYLKYRKIAK
jgi:DNA-binding winged helix-turn-helix (wHTH) protein